MPTLRQLEYLVAVADEGHFGRAARRAHASQPTLSNQIRSLELRLGLPLLDRGRHGARLTVQGREIAARARRILGEVAALRQSAASAGGTLAGSLRLGVPATLGPYLLRYLVPELHRRYPELKLHIREGLPRALEERLESGEFDLVLSTAPRHRAGIHFTPVFDEPLLMACAQDHPLAGAGPLPPHELAGQRVLVLEPVFLLHDHVQALCERHGAELLLDYEGTSLDTLRSMSGMGVGIAFLPALYVRSEITPTGDLCVRSLESDQPMRRVGLAWRTGSGNHGDFEGIAGFVRDLVASTLPELATLHD